MTNVTVNIKASSKSKRSSNAKRAKAKQLNLFNQKNIRQFGGSLLKGHAKAKRPLTTKESIHLVLKSKQAVGPTQCCQNETLRRSKKLSDKKQPTTIF